MSLKSPSLDNKSVDKSKDGETSHSVPATVLDGSLRENIRSGITTILGIAYLAGYVGFHAIKEAIARRLKR